jgi:hypothetical protein
MMKTLMIETHTLRRRKYGLVTMKGIFRHMNFLTSTPGCDKKTPDNLWNRRNPRVLRFAPALLTVLWVQMYHRVRQKAWKYTEQIGE